MKKKIIIVSVLCCSLLLFSCIAYIHSASQKTVYPSASWVNHYDDVAEMISESDLIIRGTVAASTPEQRINIVVTRQNIHIDKLYQSTAPVGDSIFLLQTGGVLGSTRTKPFPEAPLLEVGKSYLLFLELTEEGHYLIMGGYQGAGRIRAGRLDFTNVYGDAVSAALDGMNLTDAIALVEAHTAPSAS